MYLYTPPTPKYTCTCDMKCKSNTWTSPGCIFASSRKEAVGQDVAKHNCPFNLLLCKGVWGLGASEDVGQFGRRRKYFCQDQRLNQSQMCDSGGAKQHRAPTMGFIGKQLRRKEEKTNKKRTGSGLCALFKVVFGQSCCFCSSIWIWQTDGVCLSFVLAEASNTFTGPTGALDSNPVPIFHKGLWSQRRERTRPDRGPQR